MKASPILALAVLALGLLIPQASAQSPAPGSRERVAPFTDPYTVAVARLDLAALQVQPWLDAVLAAVPEQQSMLEGPAGPIAQAVQAWLTGFREAGGQEIYVVVSLSYLGMEPPVLMIAPMGDGASGERLQASLGIVTKAWQAETRVVERCVVAAPASVWRVRDAKTLSATPPEHLRTALAAAPPGVVQGVFLPYADAGRILSELLPRLPQVVGGGSSDILTRGVRWAATSLQAPPQGAMQVLIQSESPADAAALREVIIRGLNALRNVAEIQKNLPAWDQIQLLLTPKLEGDTLRIRLDQVQLTDLARQAVVPAVEEARGKAQRIALMNNLKQVALAMFIYSNDHQDQFPPHLADALPELGSSQLLVLPGSSVQPPADLPQQDRAARIAWIDQHTDLVFVLPGASVKSIKNPDRTVLVHQKPDTSNDGFVGVAFADGHVEILARERLTELLR